MSNRKELIQCTIEDLVASFLEYDRREDEELPQGEIEAALANNELTVQDITDMFRNELFRVLEQ